MPSAVSGSLGVLLDTHAVLWLMNGENLGQEIVRTIEDEARRSRVFVSPISAWEIATLVSKRRIVLSLSTETWFDSVLVAGIRLAPMPPRTLIASASLPGTPPDDPADRILLATARQENFVLITRDGAMLAYSKSGHVRALAC